MQSVEFRQDEVSERLFEIYTNTDRELLILIQNIVSPNAAELADYFYVHLLEIEESTQFLDHQLVSERLHKSMTKWIESLFLPTDKRSVIEHMNWHGIIGDVHARINIPMRLVNHGVRLIKREISKLVAQSQLSALQKFQGFILVNDLLDYSSSAINESYILHHIDHENDTQALKMHLMSFSLVVELERLRSSLFDWLRKTVTGVYEKYPAEKPTLSSIYGTEFGLWAVYKAELLFADHPDWVNKLKEQLNGIEENIGKINNLTGKDAQKEFSIAIETLNESVSNAAWLLGDLSAQAYELESGKDTLTHLFNRRFLSSVMMSVIKASRLSSSTFSVLSCDLDKFKEINDQYGHDIGDKVLVAFGNFLLSSVRTTDYVFRMGGDEFLAVLVGTDVKTSVTIAQKILKKLETNPLKIDAETSFLLRTSIGIAQYDGHPDYERILKSADEALYHAKAQGRNTYYFKY